MASNRREQWPKHERRVMLLAFLTGAPGLALALTLLWTGGAGDFTVRAQWTLTLLAIAAWLATAAALHGQVMRPLQTIANMLAALREGDFSMRARGSNPTDALGLLLFELNGLGEDLRAQRLGALEATGLLRRVMEEIDVAVFAFDGAQTLQLVNRAGAAILGRHEEQLVRRTASELGLQRCFDGDAPAVIELDLAGARGRWEMRRGTFRQGGLPHELLVLADVSRTLSKEERHAWQRLIRVLGHELNNSLAPIKSLAQSLANLLRRDPLPTDWREDLANGLGVIGNRAESLSRLMGAYARLARLPQPRLEPVSVVDWVRRVTALETRRVVTVCPGPEVTLPADGAQMDQLLINLVRNAVDASLDNDGVTEVGWSVQNGWLDLCVRDSGAGLADTGNLFVPFYTTKSNGSGIGLVLSRQIAEAHGGRLSLANRRDGRGCEARVLLPLLAAMNATPVPVAPVPRRVG